MNDIPRFDFSFRHWCDQSDHLKYGWTYHDGETFGVEQIFDENLHLNIQWLKQISGNHGGDWTTRINVTPQVCLTRNIIVLIKQLSL